MEARESSKIQRIQWADFARAVAIVLVVVCHSTEGMYTFTLEGMDGVADYSRFTAFSLFSAGRLGVPIFLFLSGYFLLDREYSNEGIVAFWKKKWIPLFICVEAWVVLLALWDVATGAKPFSLQLLVLQMLFIKPVTMGHFWYMPMILGVYVFLPIMANALKGLELRTLVFPMLIGFLFAFVMPTANYVNTAFGGEAFSLSLFDLGFIGGRYCVYLLAGWMIKKGWLHNVGVGVLLPLFCVLFLACVLMQVWLLGYGWMYKLFYENVFLALAGLCLFLMITRIKRVPCYPVAKSLSYYSFAIYLIHAPIRRVILPLMAFPAVPVAARVVLYALVLLLASWAIAIVLARIPVFGKRLLYLK